MASKPRVVALGNPRYAGKEYIEDFEKDFDFAVMLSLHLGFQKPGPGTLAETDHALRRY
jgi:hypothetical protein